MVISSEDPETTTFDNTGLLLLRIENDGESAGRLSSFLSEAVSFTMTLFGLFAISERERHSRERRPPDALSKKPGGLPDSIIFSDVLKLTPLSVE